jgi:hypothetical protein
LVVAVSAELDEVELPDSPDGPVPLMMLVVGQPEQLGGAGQIELMAMMRRLA